MVNKIVFCIVDDIESYASEEIKITIKNIVDYTISNLYIKGYDVFYGHDPDILLAKATKYTHAVVMSPGTEYINGDAFFKELEKLINKDFFVAGHILDRTMYDAYYELHHQCFVVNMAHYKRLQCPTVGVLEKDVSHIQIEPVRSIDNWHDDYTPKFAKCGTHKRTYSHKCYGWNLLRLAFENNLPVLVFNKNIRDNKRHYYPESKEDFYKQKCHITNKLEYCRNTHIHHSNTDHAALMFEKFNQLILPASGEQYLDLIDEGKIVYYDYNFSALEYWRENIPRKENIEYIFIHTDLLTSTDIVTYIDLSLSTFVNLSNIFCYEGTIAQYSLIERKKAQDNLVKLILEKTPTAYINFSLEADAGHSQVFRYL